MASWLNVKHGRVWVSNIFQWSHQYFTVYISTAGLAWLALMGGDGRMWTSWTCWTSRPIVRVCTFEYLSQLILCCLSTEVTDKSWRSPDITSTCEYLIMFPLITLASKQKKQQKKNRFVQVSEKNVGIMCQKLHPLFLLLLLCLFFCSLCHVHFLFIYFFWLEYKAIIGHRIIGHLEWNTDHACFSDMLWAEFDVGHDCTVAAY